MNKYILEITAATLLIVFLGACSSSSDEPTARMTLNLTDAPVDTAQAVVVEFNSVALRPKGGEEIVFDFNDQPKSIDLLKLQGMTSQPLLDNVEIPAGEYTRITLGVNAEFDDVLDSYITTSDGHSYELKVPSGSQNGLRLNSSFTVAENSNGIDVTDDGVYTIDFNLRKSVINPQGQFSPNGDPGYFLKPVLRFVQNNEAGSIKGVVDEGLLTGVNCSDNDPLTGNAIYVFEGANVVADDIDGLDAEPLTTALIMDDDTNAYEVGYLDQGTYTVAFTCAADLDVDDSDDAIVFDVVDNVEVIAAAITEHNID